MTPEVEEKKVIEPKTQMELRSMLLEKVIKELVGPSGGEDEEVAEANVRGRYNLGLLAPIGQSAVPEELDELAEDGADGGEEGKTDSAPAPVASMLPSAIGLTFNIDPEETEFQITANWGQYFRAESTQRKTDTGEKKLVWKRIPISEISPPFHLKEGKFGPWHPSVDYEGVIVRGIIRKYSQAWTVTAYLINTNEEPQIHKDSAWVFQPELIITHPQDKAIFIERSIIDISNNDDFEDKRMEMLYRKKTEFAVGHGIGIHVEHVEDDWKRAAKISTSIIPMMEVKRMDPPAVEENLLLSQTTWNMKELSVTPCGEFKQKLSSLVSAYSQWIQEQRIRVKNNEPQDHLENYQSVTPLVLNDCQDALTRIQEGIALLDHEPLVAKAFQFANRAMSIQRVRSIYTAHVRKGGTNTFEKFDIPKNQSWRPFQLAFVLLNLPELFDPTHERRSNPEKSLADLLWFPTGGGKTEAYLGVAAFTLGIRRLQTNPNWPSGQSGIAVLMRYTLRLLTLQQFQRATTLMCACEVIRREDPDDWGQEPFRIGLWVGQNSTPNYTKDSFTAIAQDHNHWSSQNSTKGTPLQITNCPWCGQPINANKVLVETYESGRGRTFQYCSDRHGNCPFSQRQSPDDGIPIVVVDEEIYRLLPALIIATVDKFAQMPWKGPIQMLFGRVDKRCPRHGYFTSELKDSDSHRRSGHFPAVKAVSVAPLRPPDLIIQDELHLISGPLGTMVGLYETVVDELCTWNINGKKIYPKVIASTATIRRASSQVQALFSRKVKVFPPPGIDAEDNFFAHQVPSTKETPGRLYIGICATGQRQKTTLIKVYSAFMSSAQQIFEEYGELADPWMTTVGYFNSMRELGGMRRVVDDTLRSRLSHMSKHGLANRKLHPFNVDELTSRKRGIDIPKILDRLEVTFQEGSQQLAKVKQKKYPLDVVLATNMISVGVDVPRLGLMLVACQPKATAEYIQATSRVGRRFPGIVCTVYNWARPRDLSHYERFEHYHETFYKHVEALSVTPYSPRALDRGLTALFVSLIRQQNAKMNPNLAANKFNSKMPELAEVFKTILSRSEQVAEKNSITNLIEDMLKTRVDEWSRKTNRPGTFLTYNNREKENLNKETRNAILPLLEDAESSPNEIFTCLNSLRDVEPSVSLVLNDFAMDRGTDYSMLDQGGVVSAEEEN